MGRKIKEFGLNPYVGFLLIALSIFGFSIFLYTKTPDFAQYICILVSLSFTGNLSEGKRNEFLEQNFGVKKYLQLRILENLFCALPFIMILIFRGNILSAIALLVLSVIIANKKVSLPDSFVLSTPFAKSPFEFVVGFRNTFFVILAAYVVLAIACAVNNYNLGLFSLLLLFVVISGYYTKPENEYYVWIYSKTPKQFLAEKIRQAFLQTAMLTLPAFVVISILYSQEFWILLVAYLIGYIFVMTMIFIKYSSFPMEMSIVSGIIVAFTLSFPPLLLIFAPYFYFKSIEKLERYLV